jgi:hypothetical protein
MNVTEQLIRLESQLKYTQSILAQGGLQQWEAKEYSQVAKQYEDEILELKSYIQKHGL